MKVKRDHCSDNTRDLTSSRLLWWPVAKLSRPTTCWFSFRRCSRRLEPMKPAVPVISQVLGVSRTAKVKRLYLSIKSLDKIDNLTESVYVGLQITLLV